MDLTEHLKLKTIKLLEAGSLSSLDKKNTVTLNGNQIGSPCSRKLWYQFRNAVTPKQTSPKSLSWQSDQMLKSMVVGMLKDNGITVWDKDPKTFESMVFKSIYGHMRINVDGIVKGMPEAPNKAHVLIVKPLRDLRFKKLDEELLEASEPLLWAKCHAAMNVAELERCLFISINKSTGELLGERVRLKVKYSQSLIEKSKMIVDAVEPPPRISDNTRHLECIFCPYMGVCHGCKIPEVTCGTCCHSTPEKDGTWSCTQGNDTIKPCPDHLFIPTVMPKDWKVNSVGKDCIEYSDVDTGELTSNKGNSTEIYNSRQKQS